MLALLISIVSLILIGILFIIEGVSFMTARHFTHTGEVNLASGIMLVIAGSFFCSFFLAYYGGYILLAVSAIIGGIVFVKSPIPVLMSQVPVSRNRATRRKAERSERTMDSAPRDSPDESISEEDAL
jgi:drug/metabolite transporter (DMT)-like permease